MNYQKIIKAGGVYDCVLLLPFALPFSLPIVFESLNSLSQAINLTGSPLSLSVTSSLFVNIMAIVSISFGLIRFLEPSKRIGLFDSYTRLTIALTMLYHLIILKISFIILIFVISEIIWAILQIFYIKKDV